MTKDFKNKQNSDSPFNDAASWILAGIALGLLIGLVVYIFSGNSTPATAKTSPQDNMTSTSPVVSPNNNADLASRDTADPSRQKQSKMEELDRIVSKNLHDTQNDNRPTFDYHVILPTLDVEVAVARPSDWNKHEKSKSHNKEKDHKTASKTEKTQKPTKEVVEKITKPGNYVIQVGAYRKEAEALRMKSRVSAIGINGYVQKASVKGTTWYRVRVGPMSDLNKVNQIRSLLSSKGIASFKKAVK